MEIKQLQSLVAIANHGTFSAAARSLETVQSNVSAHIARLEREVGTTLVDRASGGLTEEGEIVVQRARRILHEIEDIDADVHSLGQSPTGECRLGTIGTTGRWLISPLLRSLTRNLPGVRATVIEGTTSSLMPRLIEGEIDAAVVHLPVSDPALDATELFAEDLLLIAPGSHPLAGRESVSIVELAEHPILLAPRGTAQRRILERAAASHGVTLSSMADIDGVRLIASLVFDGFGAAILPASAAPSWITGNFVRISVPELPRRVVGWVQRSRPRPNRATFAVRDSALEVIGRHGPRQPGVSLEVGAPVAPARGTGRRRLIPTASSLD